MPWEGLQRPSVIVLLGSQCLPGPGMVTRCLHHGWVVGHCSSLSPATATRPLCVFQSRSKRPPKHALMLPNPDPALCLWSPHALHPAGCPATSPQLSMSPSKVAASHGEHLTPNGSMVWEHWDMYWSHMEERWAAEKKAVDAPGHR